MPFVQFRDPGCVTWERACVSYAALVWWTSAWTHLTAMLSCADVLNRWVKWCSLVQSWWNSVTHHTAASRQPYHKTALNATLPNRTSLLKWHVVFLIKVRKQLQPGGALCPLNSSILVYPTLAYLHVDSSYVLFYWFTVTGTDGWLRSLTLVLALHLFCELYFWNVTGTSLSCFSLAF